MANLCSRCKSAASEAAVVAVNYALIVSLFIYPDLGFRDVYRIMVRSVTTTGIIMFVISTSAILSWAMANWQIPGMIAQWVLSISDNVFVVLLLIMLLILLSGVFIETAAALIILTPVFLPLVTMLGIDLVHFGLIIVVGLAIGMVTPPVAINLYVASSVTDQPLERISRAVLPYLGALLAVFVLVVYVPVLLGWSGAR